MIEVNLFSVSSSDPKAMVGRCVARSRFDLETMGMSIMEYVKVFMKENMDTLQSGINNDLVSIIQSDGTLTTKDFMSIQYCLGQIGYRIYIWNVADDEENSQGVPDGDVLEVNLIDKTYVQHDYPTVTKVMSTPDSNLADTLETIVSQTGLFDGSKFNGIKNPFKDVIGALKNEVKMSGNLNPNLVSRIYQLLGEMGFRLFFAGSEN